MALIVVGFAFQIVREALALWAAQRLAAQTTTEGAKRASAAIAMSFELAMPQPT